MQKWYTMSLLLMMNSNVCTQDKNSIQYFEDSVLDQMIRQCQNSTQQELDAFLEQTISFPNVWLTDNSEEAPIRELPQSTPMDKKTKKEHICSLCKRVLSNASNLKRHEKLHTGQYVVYSCPQCDKKFVEKYNLDVHMRKHTGERPHACDRCNERFTQKAHLNDHKLTHEPDLGFGCPFCKHRCRFGKNMIKHIKIMHSSKSNT